MAKAKEALVGEITHFYDKLGVGIIKLKAALKPGDSIHIKGHTTDLNQTVDSLQLDHAEAKAGKKGDEIGLKVKDKVRDGDRVYLVK